MSERARAMIAALGGPENIKDLESCVTRLRLVLADPKRMDEKAVKALGAVGIMKIGTAVQVVLGTQAERVETEMKALLK